MHLDKIIILKVKIQTLETKNRALKFIYVLTNNSLMDSLVTNQDCIMFRFS
jgi:hypothetical protein